MVATVAVVDVARFVLGAPEQVGWLNLLAGWLPCCCASRWPP
ncbi:hypothetical protein [Nonomuraea africana]